MVPSDPKTNDFRYIQGTATEGARSSGGAGGDAAAEPGPGLASPLSVQGLPLFKPPYGQISAIDMNKGEMLWQVAHGETPDAIRNNPALKGVNIPRTGRAGIIGTIVTKTLVIAGEAGTITMPDGKRGAYLRAYHKKTGTDAGMIPMPAGQTGSPMTYMLDGKQYIVLAIGAAGYPAEYVAYRLPN
jgi:quinoprotein glucose dehydrogenase